MKDVATLQAAIQDIESDPSLQPVRDAAGKIVETHCNEGAERVAEPMGCYELSGLDADHQYSVMKENASGKWRQVLGDDLTEWAIEGGLGYAALPSYRLREAHGHIAAGAPEEGQFSVSLGKTVPVVANIGMTDQVEKESMAFPVAMGEPDYFIYLG